jgi:Pyridoxamine 5'-phosphate oxidase
MEQKNLDIYGDPPIPWSRALQQLEASAREHADEQQPRTYWLSTVRPDGRPHLAGVGALWLDGSFYFTSGPGTRKSRNLAANPNCAISVSLPGLDLIIEGRATKVTDQPTIERLAERYARPGLASPRHRGRPHRRLQRAQRWTAPLGALRGPTRHRVRGGFGQAVRGNSLALRREQIGISRGLVLASRLVYPTGA